MNIKPRFTAIYKILVCFFLCLMVLSIVKPSSSQSLWTVPAALSPTGSFAWFPDIASDPYGRLHAVWAAGSPGFDQVYYSSTDTGYSWTTPNDIFATSLVGNESYASRPSLLVDSNGHLNLSFVDSKAIYFTKSAIMGAASPQGWTPKMPINGSQPGYFSRMAINSKNILHFIYTQNNPAGACPICYHIYYRQSTDDGSSWSKPEDIFPDGLGAVKPQILIDKNDNIHLVWESGRGGGLGQLTNPTSVTYSASYDNGKTWSTPANLSKGVDEMGKNIAIGLDKSDNLVVAWWSLPADVIKYQISNDQGKSWSAATSIPGVLGAAAVYTSNLDDYAFANDSDGNLHLIAIGRLSVNQDTLNVLNLVWNGSKWEKPDIIATYKGDVPEWPRIAVSQGNQLYAVWFVRDQPHIWESDKGQYRVWYSKGYAASQSVGPLPLPPEALAGPATRPVEVKPSPTIEATAVGDAAPKATAPGSLQNPQASAPTSENDMLKYLAIAIIPSVLLIAFMVVFKYARRR